jgi:hypothetical protein
MVKCFCDVMLGKNPVDCIAFRLFSLLRPKEMSFLQAGLPVARLAGTLVDQHVSSLIDIPKKGGLSILVDVACKGGLSTTNL